MAPKTTEEKAERKLELQKKKEQREAKKQAAAAAAGATTIPLRHPGIGSSISTESSSSNAPAPVPCLLLQLPDDALHLILCCLSARELGCMALSCQPLHQHIAHSKPCQALYLLSRLHTPTVLRRGMVGYTQLIQSREDAIQLLSTTSNLPLFLSYIRMIQEQVCGYAPLKYSKHQKPQYCAPFSHGRFVSASPEHSISRAGGSTTSTACGPAGSAVATWGVGKRGQLGHGTRDDEAAPKFLLGGIGYKSNIRIVQVSAGGGLVRVAHTLLLTSTGRVLSFGTGQYGQLGHGYADGKQLPDYLRPKFIDALAGVTCVCVSAGELHSAAVTADGDLYTWGDGFCGQLGHGNKAPQLTPKQVETGGLDEECVAMVACGNRHSLCVTEDGQVFSFGLGHFGVLGRAFTPFEYDADRAIDMLDAGEEEGFAGENGSVIPQPEPEPEPSMQAQIDFLNSISLDDSSDQCIATRVDALDGIFTVGVSAGHRHSLFLDQQGGLYSCGSATFGALGHGDGQAHMYPMKVMEFVDNNVKIMQMSAGVDMSMVVTTTGDVYSWGKADAGRLGHKVTGIIQTPRRVMLSNTKGQPLKAMDVDCGYVHSIIVALDGTIHQCGGVGTDGQADGQQGRELVETARGQPIEIPNFNIFHKVPEPKEKVVKQERWKKYGKYELKGRSKMMADKASD